MFRSKKRRAVTPIKEQVCDEKKKERKMNLLII